MRKGFQENNFGFGLIAIAFAAIAAGFGRLGTRGVRPDIGEKQNAHGGHQDHNEQPEKNIWPSAGSPQICPDIACHTLGYALQDEITH